MFMSGSNSHFVRLITKQYPAGVVMGEKAVGKSCALDVAARQLTGLTEDDKVNQLTRVETLLHGCSFTNLPTVIEDNSSMNKEESLVVATFDKQKYKAKGRQFSVRSVFIFGTNLKLR
jgi:hypothetical protein